ncbi:hypothetical protein ACFLRU_07140 [Bacteroidota bacterium]
MKNIIVISLLVVMIACQSNKERKIGSERVMEYAKGFFIEDFGSYKKSYHT